MRLFPCKISSITHNADKSVTVTASVATIGPGIDKHLGGFTGAFSFTVKDGTNFEQSIGGVGDSFSVTIEKGVC